MELYEYDALQLQHMRRAARHEGWMLGFKEALEMGRRHATAMYIYGFAAGLGLMFLIGMLFRLFQS